MKNKNEDSFNYTVIIFLILSTAIVVGPCVYVYGIYNFEKMTAYGTLGDFIGGVLNPILTFLTFALLILSIFLQKKELGLTRIDLELSRDEMSRSANALELQIQASQQQRFDDTFFEMLKFYNEIVNDIKIISYKTHAEISGRSCFTEFYHFFANIYKENKGKSLGKYKEINVVQLSFSYFGKKIKID